MQQRRRRRAMPLALLLALLAAVAARGAGGSSGGGGGGGGAHAAPLTPDELLRRALEFRDKPDATAREQRFAAGLLREAAGLGTTRQQRAAAAAANSSRHSGSSGSSSGKAGEADDARARGSGAGERSATQDPEQQQQQQQQQQQVSSLPGFPNLLLSPRGSPAALRELARSHQAGRGVDANQQLSLELFRAAAARGDAEAQGAMGMRMAFGLHHVGSFEGGSVRHFGQPDEPAALLHYYFAAAGGDAFARAALGYRHAFGLGVPRSCWAAVAYYRPVAEAVVAEAVAGAAPPASASTFTTAAAAAAAAAAGAAGTAGAGAAGAGAAAAAPGGGGGDGDGGGRGRGLPQVERIRLSVHAGQGLRPDRQRELLQYYQYSADRGNTDAQTAVGTLLNFGTHGVTRDHAAAARYLARAAAAGSDEAAAHLGHMYAAGRGVPQDYARALGLFRDAAARGNALAQYGLGYMYLTGRGVEQDHERALKHLTPAAEAGDRDAHFHLAAMYMHGLGMKRRSLSKAFLHYFQAASLGHVQAMYNTAMMHLAGRGTPRACKPALSHLKALAEKGPVAAALQAGHEAFFRGHHAQALLLYLKAAEAGIEIGQSNAAWMLDRGFGHAGPRAAAVAALLLRRSAEQGNVASLLALGDRHFYGAGVPQDWVRAAAIYYEAYRERSAEAMFNLGYLHAHGAGVPKDAALAGRFFRMSRHTNADAALPVALAQAWLRARAAWEWLRPALPPAAARPVDWLVELRPAPAAAGAAAAALLAAGAAERDAAMGAGSGSSGVVVGGGEAGAAAGAAGAAAAGGGRGRGGGGGGGGGGAPSSAAAAPWWQALAPRGLAWSWDGLAWRAAEAAGLAGLSVASFLEEHADAGETLLLVVLLAVLGVVLRIRRQRQLALERRVLDALAQPPGDRGADGQQQRQRLVAQQIAAQLGLQIPPQPPPPPPSQQPQPQQQQPQQQQQAEEQPPAPAAVGEPAPAAEPERPAEEERAAEHGNDEGRRPTDAAAAAPVPAAAAAAAAAAPGEQGEVEPAAAEEG